MTSHLSDRSPVLSGQTIVLTGREVDWFRAKAIAIGLETWAKHKIKVNRAYTPRAMMATASKITGKTFKSTDYLGAASALRAMVDAERERERERAAVAVVFGQPL